MIKNGQRYRCIKKANYYLQIGCVVEVSEHNKNKRYFKIRNIENGYDTMISIEALFEYFSDIEIIQRRKDIAKFFIR